MDKDLERCEPTPFDTVFALATPPGVADRAVFRISGPRAFEALERLSGQAQPRARGVRDVEVRVSGAFHDVTLPCTALTFPGPRSYTGEDVVELHTISSSPVHEIVSERLQGLGLRPAWPGEFTRRAFQNGRIDLDQAEGVIRVIRARDTEDLRRAEALLLEGRERAARSVRERVVEILGLLESGLDFEAADTGAVGEEEWLPPLLDVAAELARACDGVERATGDRPAYLLLGPPNAGKTSLFNALRDDPPDGLVSATAGTTRDVRWAPCGGGAFRLGDSPGRAPAAAPAPYPAPYPDQELRILRQEAALADGFVWTVGRDGPAVEPPSDLGPPCARVRTKSDLGSGGDAPPGWIECSARTGDGLDRLRETLVSHGRTVGQEAWELGLQGRLRAARDATVAAVEAAERGLGPECVAAELRDVAAALARVAARDVPEEILDRIFASFCIGK